MTEAVQEVDDLEAILIPVGNQYLNSATYCSLSLHRQWTIFSRTCFVVRHNIKIIETHCVINPAPPPSFAFDPVCMYIRLNPLYISSHLHFIQVTTKHESLAMENINSLWLPLKLDTWSCIVFQLQTTSATEL